MRILLKESKITNKTVHCYNRGNRTSITSMPTSIHRLFKNYLTSGCRDGQPGWIRYLSTLDATATAINSARARGDHSGRLANSVEVPRCSGLASFEAVNIYAVKCQRCIAYISGLSCSSFLCRQWPRQKARNRFRVYVMQLEKPRAACPFCTNEEISRHQKIKLEAR